jgi:hypothetical protein
VKSCYSPVQHPTAEPPPVGIPRLIKQYSRRRHLCLQAVSSIRNLRTRHAVVKDTGHGCKKCIRDIKDFPLWEGNFCTRPDRPCGSPSLPYNGNRVFLPGGKAARRGANHPPSSNAEVIERVELYLYSPSGPSWPVLGRALPYLCLNSGLRT